MSQDTLFVCILCRSSETQLSKTESIPGQMLFDRLSHEIAQSDQETINLQPVRCMGACSRACTAAFMAPNKLTFILSQISPTDSVSDLLEFSHQYIAAPDGKVPYKDRPATVKQNIHAVLPPLPTQLSI
jgi:predicted metal-binding protein